VLELMEKGDREGWVRWTPEIAESRAYEDLAEAIDDFRAPCEVAGMECEKWLKNAALSDYPNTVTWVLFHAGLVQGFFVICSGTITIERPGTSDGEPAKTEMWPSSRIVWLCRRDKHEGGKFEGRTFFRQAWARAVEVGKIQGNAALVIEPFDDRIARILELRYDFFRTADQGQLWLPLYAQDGTGAPAAL
jgi:hypothetical protein